MHRLKMGVLVASANSTLEYEFQLLAGKNVSIHSTRLPHRALSDESVEKISKDAIVGARLLADAGVNSIVYGITAPSFMLGPKHDPYLTAEIRRTTGVKAITVLQGVQWKLERLNIEGLALATPYPDHITDREKAFLEDAGFNVTGSAGLDYTDVAEIGALDPSTAWDVAKRAITTEAEALFLSCTNWHTLPVVKQLSARYSIPVLTSNGAAFELATTGQPASEPDEPDDA